MRNKVSALVDGELDVQDAADVITKLGNQDDLLNDWKTYHLIGDTLRQSTELSIDISQRFSMELTTEPAIVAPYPSRQQRHKLFAYSAAASVVAMVAGWLALQTLYQPEETIIADTSNIEKNIPITPILVSTPSSILTYPPVPAEIHDYLFAHREFSSGTVTHGLTTHIHPVTDSQER
ncbi:anti sigma-E protein, RseA [Nitrosomonas cryotolerans]|uniref:Sigma-E factor negative regulatory protein RseA n=1 Tax=Nitrosomonas cryotolerans ATCC 49181 TaxID=1131553 RepID=A0A1N6IME0_9PROT|nr:sigma-E factor negative regulatory protein [Nitrosomonas cryotolerans]SFP36647.1 anti sigma-E protein, RseA [Nitrosomonas cryotolerans]SIO33145.1 sigma-E factor negative regulatory protein RseA [Nitrosomonas cryotolerans ATCC 49181]